MPIKLPTMFLSHGGGPWPYVEGHMRRAHEKLEASLKGIPKSVPLPRAILIISAHWEEDNFTVNTASNPGMLYDYYNFPPETYKVKYPAPGYPELAQRVRKALEDAGFPTASEEKRGYDHGVFVPLAVMYPEAQIPVVQLSLHSSHDPALHIKAGRALAPFREEGVLILASGLSYHNINAMLRGGADDDKTASTAFDKYLTAAVCDKVGETRNKALEAWEKAPSARQAHPREEHLIPLMVAVGAAEGEGGMCIYSEEDFFERFTVSSF